MVFEAFANMQASWNLLSSSRPHYVTFRKPRKTNGFWSILGYAAFLESLVFVSPSSCGLQKTKKKRLFFKDFGICSPLGMSCLPLALIMGLSKNIEKQVVFRSILGYAALSEFLIFVRRSKCIQNGLKIAPRSLKNAPKRPKTSNMGLI